MSNRIRHLREFGSFRLDAEKKVLWFEDQPVDLALKEVEILCVLTENDGEVITKEEILSRIWADSFVEESNLTQHIYRLRKLFKRFGNSETMIQTVPRRGYRFAGQISVTGQDQIESEKFRFSPEPVSELKYGAGTRPEGIGQEQNQLRYRTVFLISLILILVATGSYLYLQRPAKAENIKSIAVLPFKAVNSDPEHEHLGLGLTDIIITRLSQIKEISVRPTDAVINAAREESDSIEMGLKLKTDAVLEGTVYRNGEKVRVTARLIKVADGTAIWSGQFERLLLDEMRLQDEIALQFVEALALNLTRSEKDALTKPLTENPDALELYQKGRVEWNKRSWSSMVKAQTYFRQATQKDPKFALAYVGLADTIVTGSNWAEALDAIQKALELDQNLAEAHASKGFYYIFYRRQWQTAEEALKKSIELNPNYANAHHWYAQLLTIQGRHEEAKAAMRRALEINPRSFNFLADLGQIYYFNREYDEAKTYCQKALEIYPDFIFGHEYLHDIYLKTGEFEKAVEAELNAQRIMMSISESTKRRLEISLTLDKQKEIFQRNGIRNFLENLIDEAVDPSGRYLMAGRYAFLGEKEKALRMLEESTSENGFLSVFVKADPIFENLHDEPRFQEILRKMKL